MSGRPHGAAPPPDAPPRWRTAPGALHSGVGTGDFSASPDNDAYGGQQQEQQQQQQQQQPPCSDGAAARATSATSATSSSRCRANAPHPVGRAEFAKLRRLVAEARLASDGAARSAERWGTEASSELTFLGGKVRANRAAFGKMAEVVLGELQAVRADCIAELEESALGGGRRVARVERAVEELGARCAALEAAAKAARRSSEAAHAATRQLEERVLGTPSDGGGGGGGGGGSLANQVAAAGAGQAEAQAALVLRCEAMATNIDDAARAARLGEAQAQRQLKDYAASLEAQLAEALMGVDRRCRQAAAAAVAAQVKAHEQATRRREEQLGRAGGAAAVAPAAAAAAREAAAVAAAARLARRVEQLEAENEGMGRELAAHREGTLGALRAQEDHFNARLDEVAATLREVALGAESERRQLEERVRRQLEEQGLREEEARVAQHWRRGGAAEAAAASAGAWPAAAAGDWADASLSKFEFGVPR